MLRERKSDPIRSGSSRSLLGFLAIVAVVGLEHGFANPHDLLQLSGISFLLAALDTGTLLSVSYIIDPLIGDIFGLFGLRAILNVVAIPALLGGMLRYFRGIRNS